MAESRSCMSDRDRKDNYGIDVNRILDSCRDKDCYADTRVYLTDCGQELIERGTNIRVKDAYVSWTDIVVEPVQFNRGFYNIILRFYIKICADACTCPGKAQEIEGMAVVDKKVILYGGEGGVSIFRSSANDSNFCSCRGEHHGEKPETNLPTAVCEVAAPVVLDAKITNKKSCNSCCICVDDIPEGVCCVCSGCLCDTDDEGKVLLVSIGLFSVIRLERPSQFIVSASEYCVPDKECCPTEDSDPCSVFKCMAFPVNEFCPPTYRGPRN